jgi:subtilisin family serine protease
VLGVASTSAISTPSSFSNRDDINMARDEGLWAFGGERVNNVADRMYDTKDGPSGIAIGNNLLLNPRGGAPPNTTGWATWAGTSFSAPTVTGIAAALWEASGTYPTRPDLMTLLTRPASGPTNEIVLTQR